jgi:hypothetical protein
MTCCNEYRCRRTKPLLIFRGSLTGRWYVATDYKSRPGGGLEALQKHDVTDEMTAALIAAGWTPPPSDAE